MRYVLALLLLLPACKIITLGDSNTCSSVDCTVTPLDAWPERMIPLLGAGSPWRVVNRGAAGMTATGSWIIGGPTFLERILATDLADPAPCTAFRPAPKLVIALGTNDVIVGRSAVDIVTDLLALRSRALEAVACLQVYVALVPPQPQNVPSIQRTIAETNRLLRMLLPAGRVIPFDQVDSGDLLGDGVHMTPNGQQHRAEVAFAVLFPK